MTSQFFCQIFRFSLYQYEGPVTIFYMWNAVFDVCYIFLGIKEWVGNWVPRKLVEHLVWKRACRIFVAMKYSPIYWIIAFRIANFSLCFSLFYYLLHNSLYILLRSFNLKTFWVNECSHYVNSKTSVGYENNVLFSQHLYDGIFF